MQLQVVSVYVAIIVNIFLGLFIYFKTPNKRTNIFFVLMTFSIALWNTGDILMASSKNPSAALLADRISYIGAIFIPTFSIHFLICIIKNVLDKNWNRIFVIIYTCATIFLSLIFTPLIIKEVKLNPYEEVPGYFYFLFIVFFASGFLYVLYLLFAGFKKSVGLKKVQISYLFLGYLIGLAAVVIYFLILQGVNIPPVHYIVETGYVLVVGYAIVKYRLMDVKVAVGRAGMFTFVYFLILGIPFGVRMLLKERLSNAASNWWILPLLLMAFLASAGPFIYMRLQKKLEIRLRAQEFKSHEALRRLSHNMLRFTNLNILLKLMTHYLVKVLKLKFVAIYLFEKQSDKYLLSSSWQSGEKVELPREFEASGYLAEYLNLKKLPVVTEELLYGHTASTSKMKKLFSDLSAFKINTIIPSFLRNGLIGFLILSDRRNKIPFTQEDLNLLMVLSNEAALAIENAQFHQKEVSQLVEKSKREALADMAPGASHQFNNRLASISSSVELMLFKLENFKTDALQDENTKELFNDTKATLELIENEVYKGKEITSAILKRAKAKVEFQEFSLVNLIENAYKLVMISRSRSGLDKARDIKFNVVSSDRVFNVFASEALLQDVFYNLIDNSYDAIQDKARFLLKQGDSVFQGEIEATLSQEGHIVIAQVRDNGMGLTKENHRKLFTPYFTTKATSNKGSGLGLCVIRDFIEVHKGSIVCDSEYEKGTSFTIKLPIKKEKTHGN